MSTPDQLAAPPVFHFARWRKLAFAFWFVLLLLVLVCAWFPIKFTSLRLFIVVATVALWGGILLFGWKRKPVRVAWISISVFAFLLLVLPGREYSRATLKQNYLSSLQNYDGAQYVWGGESKRGIDCSGLVRCGLINANLQTGLRQMNSVLVREGLSLWWHDSSALAMKEEYRAKTRVLQRSPSLNELNYDVILPGDFAVTSNGVHALAYIGNKTWIEADPGPMRVIQVEVPSKIAWFKMPVHIIRWRQLEESD